MGFSLATFNVKDLLLPAIEAKLDWIAGKIAQSDADVLGLQEIGPPALLDAVLDRLPERGGYGDPIVGTADARGIRCALVSRLPLALREVHTAEALPFPTFHVADPQPFGARIPLRRGIVHGRVDAPGFGPVDVLVAHFKSSRPVGLRDGTGREQAASGARARGEGEVRGLVWRTAEALFVRGLADDVLRDRGAGAFVAVVGDLNDEPGSTAVRVVRGDGPEELLDCAERIPREARFSTLHDGRRTQIDHLLATASLHARLQHAAFLNTDLRQHDPVVPGSTVAPTIDSDHAPLVARFG
ncbi:MAG TPA: endonuclease/exonuclease/phosphatase family protein [Polyangiaceae bacterium]|jgi:endonuclease/exonuclease/phosphatase family metal-dependent hydrolase